MRRNEREVNDMNTILSIIEQCKVFRLAMSKDNIPYIIPLNFAYQYIDNTFEFYFHCANEGKKLDIIKDNDNVCFEMDCNHELTTAESACNYSYKFSSIIGNGKIEIIKDIDTKKQALSLLMKYQTNKEFRFNDNQINAVTLCKITNIQLSAKQNR